MTPWKVLGIVVGGMLTALVVCAAMKKALSSKPLGDRLGAGAWVGLETMRERRHAFPLKMLEDV